MATLTAENLKLVPLPKNTMVVAKQDGRLYTVDFSEYPQLDDPGAVDWNASVSKLIIGKLQNTRTRLLTLEEVEIENVVHTEQFPSGSVKDFQVTLFGSLDGHNNEITVEPTVARDFGGLVKVRCRITATNFGIQIRGTYNINTLQVTFHQNGRR